MPAEGLGVAQVGVAGDLPSALGAFAAARADYEQLAPGRLASLAVERARALVASGLSTEADRELAYAAEQAAAQRLSHTYADAAAVRAEAALLAGRPQAAAQWAREARARFLGRDNARRAGLAALLELRADLALAAERAAVAVPAGAAEPAAAAELAAAIAARGQSLARRLLLLGLPEDARVASLVAARALIPAGQLARASRVAARYGPPSRLDRLDTRLLWRLAQSELAAAAGRSAGASRHLLAGMASLHRHRTQFGCLDLQTGAAVHGQDLARAGLAAALARGTPDVVYRWSERARAQALLLPAVRPPGDPAAAAALEELRQARHTLRARELAGRPVTGLRARIEALQRSVREQSWTAPGQRDTPVPAPAPLQTIRDSLAGAVLVTYLRDGPVLRALVVAGDSVRLRTPGSYAAAQETVLRLRADLDSQAGRALHGRLAEAVRSATRHDAAAAGSAVLSPLLPDIGDRELVVVPTGILMTVPWAALPGCAGRPVTVAPSATVWRDALRRRADHRARPRGPAPPAAPAPTPAPALANEPVPSPATGLAPEPANALAPVLATEPPAVLVAGPGNARGDTEIRAIAALRPGATVLTGAAATPAATLAALGSAAVAHLAAHGQHQAENALFSTLELAGGPLLGYDLQRAGRAPAMVVLSSCDVGLTDVRPGDETFGMVTALLNAGSATVVASVARVADDAAMAAMVGFHRAVTAGRPPAAALAAALQEEPTAGFVCFGAG